MTKRVAAGAVFAGLTLWGCIPTGELKTRAAYDFNCPAEDLKLIELQWASYAVEGCGKRAVYVLNKSWIRNSDVQNYEPRKPQKRDIDADLMNAE